MRGEGYSLSDIAAATGNGNNGFGNGGDFGAWWIIIFLIFAFGGWGGNRGFGGNGTSGGSVMDAYVLNSDFATLQRLMADGFTSVNTGINQVNQGLCNGFYQEAQLFANTNQNIMQGNFNLQTAINGVQSQLAECCCTTQRAIDGVNYNMATNTCAITNAINNGIRDVVDNQNANYRALHDEITANRIEDKNAQITAQQNEINALRLAASQEKQNNYLVNELKPCPIPAYITCNPWANTCGCGTGCGNF